MKVKKIISSLFIQNSKCAGTVFGGFSIVTIISFLAIFFFSVRNLASI